ncbi:ABC transporter permease [Pseudomonas mosselii]|uniref:Transport permease protein n=1 Tax=Pseudomonas mosselii TaxID=78327 RepID=A0AA42RUZ4_9PSED|nr:ABC transporter permease [Pseudomonas mosselii]MDH1630668.1 ABC transporter permease [Pseudomonas mosselii]
MTKRFTKRLGEAWSDLRAALIATETWVFLGTHDIRQRYRRSVLGPLWITISTAVLIGGLGVMYAGLFKMDVHDYIPYLAAGMITWSFMSVVITESCLVFTGAEGSIKAARIPLASYVLRLVWRNVLVFLHNAVVLVGVVLWFLPFNPMGLLQALVGLAVIGVFLFWLALAVGLLCARFRDIPLIVTNVLQVVFFMTPIMWKAEVLNSRMWIAEINPFYYMLELVRNPLLGQPLTWSLWGQVGVVLLATVAVSFLLFARFRSRIVYWL